jgi:hypothetical protein
MVAWADAVKTDLAASLPLNFAHEAFPAPHISLLQQSIRSDKLDSACRAIENVLVDAKVGSYKLAAHKYLYTGKTPITLRAVTVRPTAQLLLMRKRLADAIHAFIQWSEGIADAMPVWERVIPDRPTKLLSGLNPARVQTMDDLDDLLARVVRPFVFAPSLASIYRVGAAEGDSERLRIVALAARRSARQLARPEPARTHARSTRSLPAFAASAGR